MNRIFLLILGLLLVAGGIFGIVMTVMAAIFMEYGRVIFYLTIALSSFSLSCIPFMKIKESKF